MHEKFSTQTREAVTGGSLKRIELNGRWSLAGGGRRGTIGAKVPGCVHLDLMKAHRIGDPFWRGNETDIQWVGERDWIYRRHFKVSRELFDQKRIFLECDGLDTLATIRLNGQPVGKTDNMFRQWKFEVRNHLRAGSNEISILFRSPLAWIRKKQRIRHLHTSGLGQYVVAPAGWLRKEACNFGWDWGPKLVTCGIWRDIALVGFGSARLSDVQIAQDHSRPGRVFLDVRIAVERVTNAPLRVGLTLTKTGRRIGPMPAIRRGGTFHAWMEVPDPELWWPNGMGKQPLYELSVELLSESGSRLDAQTRRIGLRTIRLQRRGDRWGQSFQFVVNGIPFFAKGANWIPADCFVNRLSADNYETLLSDAAEAHMNMIRVWGGGIYEPDLFYDLCDRLGLCVWQDFMFACSTYPTFDPAFMRNVRVEVEQQVRRLRHHASIALWCGNNEMEPSLTSESLTGKKWSDTSMSWSGYSKLFDRLLPAILRKLDLSRDYWPSSPHTPVGDRQDRNNPHSGDAHLWGVWHRLLPFESYRQSTHRFNSEFGFQSFPEPQTIAAFTEVQDRNITSPVMEHHQRSAIGNTTIMRYMLDWFRIPKSFEMTIWLSQIQQGIAIKYGVEHWRRIMPRNMGALYWQLNDCWPAPSWSSIDCFGRWKALHYMAKNFFAPLLISGVENLEDGTVEIHVSSDRLEACGGKVLWRLSDLNGRTLCRGDRKAKIPARRSACLETLDFRRQLRAHGPANLLLWLILHVDGRRVSTNLVHFARPKQMELPEPRIRAKIRETKSGVFNIRLTAQRPALWAWLALDHGDARWSDNFFHLQPGVPEHLIAMPKRRMTASEFRRRLRVQSLLDTYSGPQKPDN